MSAFNTDDNLVSDKRDGNKPFSRGLGFDGEDLSSFEFTDMPENAKSLYRDISSCHKFKVRGANYCEDKVKVEGGPPIMKFMLLEVCTYRNCSTWFSIAQYIIMSPIHR